MGHARNPVLFVFLLFAAGWVPHAGASPKIVLNDSETPQYLFVQTAWEGTFAGRTLTLKRVSPVTLFFSDRPARIAGHILTGEFVERFSKDAGKIDADPPNATLSVMTPEGEAYSVVLELKNPKLDGDTLQYEVRVLEGRLPVSFGVASLFFEGTPGSPVLATK
jgi:hypothetical protein